MDAAEKIVNDVNKAIDNLKRINIADAVSLLETSLSVASSYVNSYSNEIVKLANESRPYMEEMAEIYGKWIIDTGIILDKMQNDEKVFIAMGKLNPGSLFKAKHALDLLKIKRLSRTMFGKEYTEKPKMSEDSEAE